MLACKLCAWLCDRFCAEQTDSFWRQSDAWERYRSNDYELWLEAPAEDRERASAAIAGWSADPEGGLRMFTALADGGMAWAMEATASRHVVAGDIERARDYYRRAIEAGSWMATIGYARLLAGQGEFETCEAVLRDGVEADFIPAHFWLARYRLKQSRSVATCRAVRPLLEHAAAAGHPAAEAFLANIKVRGKFGLREIPAGFQEISRVIARRRAEDSAAPEPSVEQAPALG